MPLHNMRFQPADLLTLLLSFLIIYQPGVDRKATMKWITDTFFFGKKENVHDWGIFAFHKTVEWGSIIVCSILYTLEIPLVERWKTYPIPWPWKSPDPEVRKEFSILNKRAFWYVVKFHSIVATLNFVMSFFPRHRIACFDWEKTPEWHVSAYQILISMLIADAGHYWGHRLLHLPQFYKWHKMHHEFKHNTVIAGFYITWVELFVTDLIPAGVGVIYFDMHIYTFWIYSIPPLFAAVWGHSGYTWVNMFNPFQVLPFSTEIELTHDFHHRGTRLGEYWNYGGGYYIWDRLAGTYMDPYYDEEYKADRKDYMKRFDVLEDADKAKVE
jgi:sterol desaturase/sphingolipid hydroxylase (fatty acid hydroxylase superfamily)